MAEDLWGYAKSLDFIPTVTIGYLRLTAGDPTSLYKMILCSGRKWLVCRRGEAENPARDCVVIQATNDGGLG